jgi:hypothetical protein
MASVTPVFADREPAPDYFSWRVEGKPVDIRLDFDVIDRLEAEVLQAFGSASRMGSEVGGLLLGSVLPGPHGNTVHITDFELVPLPSAPLRYVPAGDQDAEAFRQVVETWAWTPDKATYVVGMFRSHTGEGLALVDVDYDLFERFLPDPSAVILLVKPYATRACQAGFFFREEGGIRGSASYLEFPFRRRDLISQLPPQPESAPAPLATDFAPATEGISSMATASSVLGLGQEKPEPMPSDDLKFGLPTSRQDDASGKRIRTGWVWIPLSFIFLLLGVVLGFQVALSVRSHIPAGFRQDPYALNLSISPAGDSLHVRWDRNAPAVQAATRGWLIIQDGGAQKTVDLDATQLQSGSVIYRRASASVRFRLEVLAGGRVTVGESLDFRSAGQR